MAIKENKNTMTPAKPSPAPAALAVPEGAALARPSFIPQGDRSGATHIKDDDVQMPRLLIAQGLSPQLKRNDPAYIEGLSVGDIFNSLDNRIHGVGPIEFVVIRADRPRYIEFHPREKGGGIKDPNVPAGDPRTEFGPNGEPPVATKFYDFVIMLLSGENVAPRELVALSLKSTGLRVARQLNGLIKQKNAPVYAGAYVLRSVETSNSKGTFGVFSVRNAGWVDERTFHEAKACHEGLSGKEINIAREPGQDDDIPFGENV